MIDTYSTDCVVMVVFSLLESSDRQQTHKQGGG